MSPKNIHTHGYYDEDPTDKPHRDVETDFESGESSKPETPTRQKKVTTSDNPEDDVVTVSHDSTPSPTASDILSKFHIGDIEEAHNLDRKWREEKLSDQERKEKLKIALEKFNRDGEASQRRDEEEMKKRYEEDGEHSERKGEGKEV